eukprot:scaffold20163_cov45-Phaeocystis_antarctica.AAC.1
MAVAPPPPPPPPPPRQPCEGWCDDVGMTWAVACAGGRDGAWADRCSGCAPCVPPPPPPCTGHEQRDTAAPCVPPPSLMVHFNVSLNGQQWHSGGEVGFAVYDPPAWDEIAPTGGPLWGGTLVRVRAAHDAAAARAALQLVARTTTPRLGGGAGYTTWDARCRFGDKE